MVHNSVHNLCESLVENIGGVSGATSRKVVVATPVITLTGNSVTITCATTGATIYYTLDGSTPTSSSTQYSAAFTLDSSCTIKAIAIKGGKSSGIAEEEYVKPITYLTQWKIVGNSEVHGNEIWSCGEYSAVDGKYHILVQPLGGSIADIALDEPLRMTNEVADSIEYANGVGTLTRKIGSGNMGNYDYTSREDLGTSVFITNVLNKAAGQTNLLSATYKVSGATSARNLNDMEILGNASSFPVYVRDMRYSDAIALKNAVNGVELIYELATPTTETIQVPQIAEADTYTCVISQGGKAVEWSSFETE